MTDIFVILARTKPGVATLVKNGYAFVKGNLRAQA